MRASLFGTLAGGGAWTPASLASITHWYRVRDLSGYANNDPVGTLPDLIGTADLASTLTARPLYQTNAGDPYLLFDGINDQLTSTITSFTDGTVVMVMEFLVDAGYDALYAGGWMWANSSGSVAFQPFTATSQYIGGYGRSFPSGNLVVFIQRNGTTMTVRKDGSEQTGTVTPSASGTTLGISANVVFAGRVNITMRELVMCNAAISAGEFTDLATYISDQYGLTL